VVVTNPSSSTIRIDPFATPPVKVHRKGGVASQYSLIRDGERESPDSVISPLSFSIVPTLMSLVLTNWTSLDHDSLKSASAVTDLSNGLISIGAEAQAARRETTVDAKIIF
jgi:hypothetical protein